MTVSTTNRKNDFSTNGVTVDFPFTFAVTDSEQVKALTVDSEGLEADYINFTISLNTATAGGTLTTGDVLDGVTLIIYRLTQLTQNTDYVGGGRFPADSHEQALDKLTLQNQDQQEEIDRSLKYDIGTDISDVLSLSDYDKTVDARDEATLQAANDYTDNQVIEAGAITPNNINMFAGGKNNEINNPQFIVATPDAGVTPPSATPTSYLEGEQIFSGWFVGVGGVTNLTHVSGLVNADSGVIYYLVPNTGALESLNDFTASVADLNLKPSVDGVSYALDGDNYKVELDLSVASDVFSTKFEVGLIATGHEGDGRNPKLSLETIKIPTDYPTLQEAFDSIKDRESKYRGSVDLLVESGHQLTSGLIVSNGDYAFISISAEDSIVTVDTSFSDDGLIDCSYAASPVLNCLVDLNNKGGAVAFNVSNSSKAFIKPGCGIINGNGRGLHVHNASRAMADYSIFTGYQRAGIHASRTGDIQCSYADFSGNSQEPTNTFGGVYASRTSRIHGAGIDATNSGGDGIRAQRNSLVSVPGINVSGAKKIAIVAVSGARIYSDVDLPIMLNLQGQAIVAQQGALVSIGGSTITFAGGMTDFAVESRASQIVMDGANLSGHEGIGLYAKGAGANISAGSLTMSSQGTGAQAEECASISISNCNLTGDGSGNGAVANEGAKICCTDGSITGYSNDLSIAEGSWISANSCTTTNGAGAPDISDTNLTGGFNFSDNGSRGFIWK